MAMLRYAFFAWFTWLAVGCSTTPAPVIDRAPPSKQTTVNKSGIATKAGTSSTATTKTSSKVANGKNAGDWRPDTHTVKKGDTLFSIGLEYGYDYKDIARVNNIDAPYVIKVGQTLKLAALKEKTDVTETKPAQEQGDGVVTYPISSDGAVTTTNNTASTPVAAVISEPKAVREPYSDEAFKTPLPAAKPVTAPVTAAKTNTDVKTAPETKETKTEIKPDTKPNAEPAGTLSWSWPTKGKVISGFNDSGNKGIDIAGTKGQPILAAAPGKVIYSGSDLRGYGKLVIVKHNNTYLSVYANNSNILVKEGQQVSAGQKIAEMGDSDSNTVKLHFEIRQQGKSVDPAKFLAVN